MKEKIKSLFSEDNKSPFEIAEMLRLSIEEVINILKECGLHKFSDRKYYIMKGRPLTKEQREFIFGCLLGNGSLRKHGKRTPFYVHIEDRNRNNILWKKLNLANYVNVINKKEDSWWFETVTLNELNTIHKKMYDNNKKVIRKDLITQISPLSLAVLFVDKGMVLPAQTIRFRTHKFSQEDHENLREILKISFGINSKICRYKKNDIEYCYLSLNKRNSEIFMKTISPHIQEILRD